MTLLQRNRLESNLQNIAAVARNLCDLRDECPELNQFRAAAVLMQRAYELLEDMPVAVTTTVYVTEA